MFNDTPAHQKNHPKIDYWVSNKWYSNKVCVCDFDVIFVYNVKIHVCLLQLQMTAIFRMNVDTRNTLVPASYKYHFLYKSNLTFIRVDLLNPLKADKLSI